MPRAKLDRLDDRDRRIANLEARFCRLTAAEQDELQSLLNARDHAWRRLPHRIDHARRQLDGLIDYARRIGLDPDHR